MSTLDVARLRSEFTAPHDLIKTSDGRTLFLRRWGESNRSDVVLLVFHGITAYSEPYGKLLGEELASAGFPVVGLDLRGHGRSDGRRGDLPGPERLALDLRETVAHLRRRYARVILLGHSLGVITAAHAYTLDPSSVAGLVLLSAARDVRPGAYAPPPAGAALKALLGIALFRGTPLIEYRRAGMMGRGDPLFNFRYSARFYSSMYGTSAMTVASNLRENRIGSPYLDFRAGSDIPVFVGVGDQDEIFSVAAVQAFAQSLPFARKDVVIIPGARHASFPPGAWGPLLAWLGRNFPAPVNPSPG